MLSSDEGPCRAISGVISEHRIYDKPFSREATKHGVSITITTILARSKAWIKITELIQPCDLFRVVTETVERPGSNTKERSTRRERRHDTICRYSKTHALTVMCSCRYQTYNHDRWNSNVNKANSTPERTIQVSFGTQLPRTNNYCWIELRPRQPQAKDQPLQATAQ